MRALLLLLAACAGTGDPTPAARSPSPTAPPVDSPHSAAPPATATPPPSPQPTAPPTAEPTPGDASPEVAAQCADAAAAHLAGPTKASATVLNTAGFRCYRADRLDDALALFGRALDTDPTHALAHYNLAATLGVLRGRGDICGSDATLARMMTHLEAAVRFDAGRRARLNKDPDLAALRTLPRFRVLQGADPATRRGVVQAVQGATFYAPAPGAFGHPLHLTLQGAAPHKDLEHGALPALTLTRTVTDQGALETTEQTGGWAIDEQGRVLVDPNGGAPGPEVQTWGLTPRGDLAPLDGGGDRLLGMPDECSA